MNKIVNIEIKQKQTNPNLIKDLSNGDIVQLYGDGIGLSCCGDIVLIVNGSGVPSFDIIRKSELTGYNKRLGTLAGITVQED